MFRKKFKTETLSPIAEVARTPQGRGAIALGLATFYETFGDGNSPWLFLGSGQRTKAPIGVVLAFEGIEFVGHNHSYPTCKKQ